LIHNEKVIKRKKNVDPFPKKRVIKRGKIKPTPLNHPWR
jgi:hypothetical protein